MVSKRKKKDRKTGSELGNLHKNNSSGKRLKILDRQKAVETKNEKSKQVKPNQEKEVFFCVA